MLQYGSYFKVHTVESFELLDENLFYFTQQLGKFLPHKF